MICLGWGKGAGVRVCALEQARASGEIPSLLRCTIPGWANCSTKECGNLRVMLGESCAFQTWLLWPKGLLKVRDSCLILKPMVLLLPFPEPDSYGDLGLGWDSAWMISLLKLMSPKAGIWLGVDALALPVPLRVATGSGLCKKKKKNLFSWAWILLTFFSWVVCSMIRWAEADVISCLNVAFGHWYHGLWFVCGECLLHEWTVLWLLCMLTKAACTKLGTQQTLSFSVVLGRFWGWGLQALGRRRRRILATFCAKWGKTVSLAILLLKHWLHFQLIKPHHSQEGYTPDDCNGKFSSLEFLREQATLRTSPWLSVSFLIKF